MRNLRKNTVMRLIVSASFASVLLEPLGVLPFVVYIHGKTGTGKTIAMMAAASVWGNPEIGRFVRSLNNTQNFAMRTNVFLKNMPFIADELQTIKSNYAEIGYDKFIMNLTEGSDRGRLNADSSAKFVGRWRNIMIFSGEEPITDEASGGGTKNRVLEIDISDEKVVQDGHETACFLRSCFGHAGRRFLELFRKIDCMKIFKDTKESLSGKTDEKQATSMAVLLTADYIVATHIFQEKLLSYNDFSRFLKSKDEIDASERAYKWVLDWVSSNEARFHTKKEGNVGECYGWKECNGIFVNNSVLYSAMKKANFNFMAFSKEWKQKGYIEPGKDGKAAQAKRVEGVIGRFVKIRL
jgi:uncharacterized protein (DUF927 family)